MIAGAIAFNAETEATSQFATHGTWEPLSSKTVLATLDTLPIKGRAPKAGYSRSQFGQAWSDDVTVAGGRNGCDTRFLGVSTVLQIRPRRLTGL